MNWSDYLEYEPSSGRLLWKVSRGGPIGKPGIEAGTVKTCGRYRSFVLNHKRYYTHRVIWEIVNGPIPEGMCIDHLDGNGLNNRIENLRAASLSANQRNRRVGKNTPLGILGVMAHRGGFTVSCASKYVKWTADFFEACCIRKSAELRMGYHIKN
jgi:hypothetical protein